MSIPLRTEPLIEFNSRSRDLRLRSAYVSASVRKGIEILTGCPAGQRQRDGTFEPGTVNYIAEKRLLELNESMRGYYGALISDKG